MSIKVGFTGTQVGMTTAQKATLRKVLVRVMSGEGDEFHHGDCIGADAEAAEIARLLDFKIVGHPPLNASKRAYVKCDILLPEKEYLDRDRDIVDVTALLIAAPKGFKNEVRSGTWYTLRYAKAVAARDLYAEKKGQPVEVFHEWHVVYPDGSEQM